MGITSVSPYPKNQCRNSICPLPRLEMGDIAVWKTITMRKELLVSTSGVAFLLWNTSQHPPFKR